MMQVTTVVAFFIIFQFGVLVKGQAPTPTAEVTCPENGQGITITISGLTDLDQWTGSAVDAATWDISSDSGCDADLNSTLETASYGPFDASVCATSSDLQNVDYFEYEFAINPDEGPANTPVRRYDHNYTATCRYYRNGTVWANFTPVHELTASDVGSGDFTFALNLYSDDGHSASLPATVNLETTIYAQVNVTDTLSGTQLDVFLDRCWASTDMQGLVDPYNLIVDSCENQQISEVDYDCEGQTTQTEEFNFLAFRYSGQTAGNLVHIHCEVYVCLDDPASFCQTQCNDTVCDASASRKRRDADQFGGDQTYRVDAGPYRFVDGEEGQEVAGAGEQAAKSGIASHVAIILSVSGVVAIAIVCVVVVVVLRKRRQNVTLAGGEAHDNNMKI